MVALHAKIKLFQAQTVCKPYAQIYWSFGISTLIKLSLHLTSLPVQTKKSGGNVNEATAGVQQLHPLFRVEKCPICSGQKVLEGFNDLATVNPSLAREWHPTLNGKLTAKQVTAGSSKKKVWWLCPRGHEYQATVANRSNGTGCPICKKEQKTSFPEQAILFYLGKHTEVFSRYLLNQKVEIDIYLPLLKIGIEYDGYHFHQGAESRKKELRKDSYVKEAGITLFRIKEYKRDE